MRTLIFIFLTVVVANSISAQEIPNKNLQSLIDTELAFAKMAKNQNTRNAFLHYLSKETVMFINGEIKIGMKAWNERSLDSTLLVWQPIFADISASGDFGYTTGPSEFYENRNAGAHAHHGSYITMWKRDSSQHWKMALDIGVYPQPEPASRTLITPKFAAGAKRAMRKDKTQDLMKHEMQYVRKLSTGADFASDISNEARFLRPNMQPETDKAKITAIIKKEAGKANYNPVDVSVSSAGDMAYVYGKVSANLQDKVNNGHYLRIYKKENGRDWKIVLDAMQ